MGNVHTKIVDKIKRPFLSLDNEPQYYVMLYYLSCYLSISSVVVPFFVIPLRTQTVSTLSGGMLREILFPSWWWCSLIRYMMCVEFLHIFISTAIC